MARTNHVPRNSFLVPGITRYSRSVIYAKKAMYKRKKTPQPKQETKPEQIKTVQVKGEKNGEKRLVPVNKAPRFYPAEDIPVPKKSRKVNRPAKLRTSITPGTVLILLAGRFRGKRVVFLKQLPGSGLLLVTGPYKLNGVPLRRVNQAYVIATSTKIDVSGVSLDKFDDNYFKREKNANKKATEEEFFKEGEKQKKEFPAEKASLQKEVDKPLIANIKKDIDLYHYLRSRFTLTKGVFPHKLKF
ncbi:10232_t:CDS:2 [Ambispora leptoticha]|uniref:60S ribosomal protein L6 n=1 Tax=Ambispora leptoticha TaxID=144679 RepID=A0A9N8VTX7_9GLOM|nr:10232_t:CDS:2 [Ambispora leptoticha]